MIPSARLVVYHVAAGGHIAADSLSFPVIPAPGKEVSNFLFLLNNMAFHLKSLEAKCCPFV
jgi:hypothetical protein